MRYKKIHKNSRGILKKIISFIYVGWLLGSSSLFAAYSTTPYNSYPPQSDQYEIDQKLTQDIQARLSKGSRARKYANVSFYVSYSNVTLEGYVDSLDYKSQITRDVLSVKGVKQIDNKITVQPPASKYAQ